MTSEDHGGRTSHGGDAPDGLIARSRAAVAASRAVAADLARVAERAALIEDEVAEVSDRLVESGRSAGWNRERSARAREFAEHERQEAGRLRETAGPDATGRQDADVPPDET